jgi:hypothetical protein
LYKLNLYLSYEDSSSGVERETDTIAGIYVGGETDFEVAFSESSSGQMSFSVANTGSNPANSISVVVPEQTGWIVTGSSSAIIGNLNQGDYTVASFTLQQSSGSTAVSQIPTQGMTPPTRGTNSATTPTGTVSEKQNASNSNLLKIQIVYTDTMGKRRTIEKEVKVSGTSSSAVASISAAAAGYSQGFGRVQQQSFVQKYRWYLLGGVVLIAFAIFIFFRYKQKRADASVKQGIEKKTRS